MAPRKTIDTWEIQAEYGHGWETDAVALTIADAVEMHRQLRSHCPYPVRTVKVRIRKDSLSAEEAERLELTQKERLRINKEAKETQRKNAFKEPP